MKTDEEKTKAMKALEMAETPTSSDWGQVSALRAIAWAIIYLADVLRYKIITK
jgi:hypothetical protein